jgi:hypothetical protein
MLDVIEKRLNSKQKFLNKRITNMGYRVVQFIAGLSALSLLFVVGCEGPAGPQGPLGDKGEDVASQRCGFSPDYFLRCHGSADTTYHVAAMKFQYEASRHGSGAEFTHTSNTCAGCHIAEGFYERYNRGFSNETFTINVPSGPICYQNYSDIHRINCFTCHAPHERGNFSVRDSNAVNIFTLVGGQTTTVWNSTASSNLCVKCHQPRMTSHFLILGSTPVSWQPDPSKVNAIDTAKIYTSSWNNHVSGQPTQIMLGTGGVEFSGYSYRNYANSYGHTSLIKSGLMGCENCHMATVKSGNQYGGHTFSVRYLAVGSTSPSYNVSGCNVTVCHPGLTTSDAHWTKRATIIAKIAELGKLMMDTTITKKWSLPIAGKAVAWTKVTTSSVVGDSSWSNTATSSAPLVIVPAFKAGALWNLIHVQNEKSHGIHNYRYDLDLLQSSIDELNK